MLYYFDYPVSGTFRLIGQKPRSKIKCTDATMRSGSSRAAYGNEYDAALEGSSGIPDGIDHRETTAIVGDNYLRLHEATLLAHAGLERADVAYASFEAGGFYEMPYCIVIDHRWRSVVLWIRGSLTLEDCVVDVLLDPCPLDALGEKYGFSGGGQYCHGGVLECAQWLHEDLMRYVPYLSVLADLALLTTGNLHIFPGTKFFRNCSREIMLSIPTTRCASSATLWAPASASFCP